MLTKKDLEQIKEHGLSLDDVYHQLKTFSDGIGKVDIVTAASVDNGIVALSKEIEIKFCQLYENRRNELDIVKFVPASGAATRMFKFLHTFLDTYDPNEALLSNYIKEGNYKELQTFFSSLKEFPFVNLVRKKIREKYPDYKIHKKGHRLYCFVQTLLTEKGLDYSNMPKGLIPFHKYTKYATTAFEEQLYEAAYYASSKDEVYLKFTFSEDHVSKFRKEFEAIRNRITKKTKTKFNISYSFQKKETDTIAVGPDNKPFRDLDGNLVFRPSGHGALLENLNEVNADIIFIKNIDNVVAEEYVPHIAHYKKIMAGKLLWLQDKIFDFLRLLDKEEVSIETINEIKSFLFSHLNIKYIPEDKIQLAYILSKPLRVCGVVKNTGAPGGGPFWVKDSQGNISLQIIEMAQIDIENEHQGSIVDDATHFNPVDIVCAVKDYKGNKFDLKKFNNPNMGFITEKSQNGQPLKALELPGLWNGAMAKWNTVMIEVPLETFNPVKTVNDLLAREHRPNA